MRKNFIVIALMLAAVAAGQVVKVNLLFEPRISFILADIALIIFSFGFLVRLIHAKKFKDYLSFLKTNKVWFYYFIFLLWALLSLIINASRYSLAVDLTAVSYWGRLAMAGVIGSYLHFEKSEEKLVSKMFLLWGMVVLVFGFLQLIFVPDFSFMTVLGWDPHNYRMLSTFYDPNYLAIFLLLVMAVAAVKSIITKDKIRYLHMAAFFAAWVGLYFTFSRSGWLAGAIALPIAVWSKNWKISLAILAVFIGLVIIPNRLGERFLSSGSFLSERVLTGDINANIENITDQSGAARTISIRRGLELFKRNWLIGVGYNAYGPSLAQSGITADANLSNLASQGSDSSIVNILATTGVIGFFLFLLFAGSLLKNLYHGWQKATNGLATSLFGFSFGLFAGSFFVNSLFYVLILLPFMILLAAALKEGGNNEKID